MDGLTATFKNKENAARIVLQEASQNGHRCIELKRDGRAVIFICTVCSIRCYSDTTLVEHLRGNRHARKLASTLAPASPKVDELCVEKTALSESAVSVSKPALHAEESVAFPASSLEWIGSGKVCLWEDQSDLSQQVKGIWCQWLGRNLSSEMHATKGSKPTEDLTYGVVVFPYSDAIGRRGDWKPGSVIKKSNISPLQEFSQTDVKENNQSSIVKENLFHGNNIKEDEGVELHFSRGLSEKGLRKALKQKRLNLIERFCFICHQQMLPGRVVAAVLNLKTNQMACNSRNERGAFHVFHLSCLVDWILLCESKFWSAFVTKKDGRRMRGQVNKKPRKGKTKNMAVNSGRFFCPECQGTGVEVHCHQLEQPRYRLAQVFEWILELIQARRLWMCHPEKPLDSRGLIFSHDVHCQSSLTILGSLHFYAAGSLDFLGEGCSK